jgi:hypothetical protein
MCSLALLVISLLAEMNLVSGFWWRLDCELHVIEPEDLLHWLPFCLDSARFAFGSL